MQAEIFSTHFMVSLYSRKDVMHNLCKNQVQMHSCHISYIFNVRRLRTFTLKWITTRYKIFKLRIEDCFIGQRLCAAIYHDHREVQTFDWLLPLKSTILQPPTFCPTSKGPIVYVIYQYIQV